MAFRPLHDRVVVKRLEGEEKTKGGIIIPDTAKEKPQEGEIVAVGPGARDDSGKLVPLDEGETVVSMYGRSLEGKSFIFFATRKGISKRLPLSEITRLNRAGKRVLTLDDGDEIAQVRLTSGDDELLFMTANGQGLRVCEEEFRPMGRTARGVKGIRLRPAITGKTTGRKTCS